MTKQEKVIEKSNAATATTTATATAMEKKIAELEETVHGLKTMISTVCSRLPHKLNLPEIISLCNTFKKKKTCLLLIQQYLHERTASSEVIVDRRFSTPMDDLIGILLVLIFLMSILIGINL